MKLLHSIKHFITHIQFINIYLTLVGVFLALVVLFLVLAFRSMRKQKKSQQNNPTKSSIIKSQDIRAIAGDDIMTTQLDLARAYIEMDKKQLAKKILSHVVQHGTAFQKQEAYELMVNLEPA